MVDLTRRGLLFDGAATIVFTAFGKAAAADENPANINSFYRAITKKSFKDTYGDSLSPKRIHGIAKSRRPDIDHIDKGNQLEIYGGIISEVLSGTAEEYQKNYIDAAKEYFESLSAEDLQTLEDNIKYQYNRAGRPNNLLGAVSNDLIYYTRAGRTPNKDATNPLFYAFYDLARNNNSAGVSMLTKEDSIEWINLAASITHGEKSFEMIHQRLTEAIDEVQVAAPIVAPVPPPEKKF